MKKTLTSLIIGIAAASSHTYVYAEDLLSVYEQAKAADPTVLSAEAQFQAAKDGVEISRAVLLPQVNATAGYAASKIESYTLSSDSVGYRKAQGLNMGLNFNMQLYRHDSWLKLDNAKKSAHRSDVSYQAAKQDLIIRVTDAYFAVLSAQDDLEFSKAEKKAIERQLEQTKQRYAVGLTAITDVHEAQAQYDNAVTAEIRAENDVYFAEESLRVITNVYPRDLSVLNTERFSTTQLVPNNANEWQRNAEEKNLDLIAQKISVDIAKENINIARSGHYPTIDFSGNYGKGKDKLTYSGASQYSEPYLDNYSVGVTLTVPIYSGGAVSASVSQAQKNYVVANQNLALQHRNVVSSTRNNFNTVNATISAIKALEQSVISAESALKATEAGFEVGTRTIVDVLDSTRNLYNAKRNLSSTRYGYIRSILALKRSAGTITEADLADINKGLQAI